jgi:eukaryotic-like serine/threonine-protein kinase
MNLLPCRPGDVVAGKYRVEKMLASGGMGVVVTGMNVELRQLVAIKMMHPHIADNAELSQRFRDEAKIAANLKSEHIAKVSDFGEHDGKVPYMVMEYLEGIDLAARLKEQGPLPLEEAVRYALHVCEALAEAHPRQLIHRDLKPANLFLTTSIDGSPCVKVLDFGIAKLIDGRAATKSGVTLGSALYMSPEQMRAQRDIDARSDLWSLGVVLYKLVTDAAPFMADTEVEVSQRVTSSAPSPPSALRPELPPAFDAVVLRCLEKDRAQRYANVVAFAAALRPLASEDDRSIADRAERVFNSTTKFPTGLSRAALEARREAHKPITDDVASAPDPTTPTMPVGRSARGLPLDPTSPPPAPSIPDADSILTAPCRQALEPVAPLATPRASCGSLAGTSHAEPRPIPTSMFMPRLIGGGILGAAAAIGIWVALSSGAMSEPTAPPTRANAIAPPADNAAPVVINAPSVKKVTDSAPTPDTSRSERAGAIVPTLDKEGQPLDGGRCPSDGH